LTEELLAQNTNLKYQLQEYFLLFNITLGVYTCGQKNDEPIHPHGAGLEMEYTTLRTEILQRIGLRQQVISISLTLAGIFLSVGLTNELVSLIYPPLAMLLAFGWAQNDFRIRETGGYIREYLESPESGLAYETLTQKYRQSAKGLGAWRFVVISHGGMFLLTQVMAVVVEVLRFAPLNLSPIRLALFTIDAISIIIVYWLMRQSTRKERSP
jgi:uncharacterized membrane protein YqaE (UPF0057 family)